MTLKKKYRRFFLLFTILLLLAATISTSPATTETTSPEPQKKLDQVLFKLRKTAAATITLSAEMEQEKHLAIFSRVLRSSGHFYFRRPDCWCWELDTPMKSGLAVCNDSGRSWSQDQKKTDRFPLSRKPWLTHFTAQITAWTTANLDFLKKQYDLTLLKYSPPLIRLTPKNREARRLIKTMEIGFASDLSHVRTITIRENDGDFTVIRFSRVIINQPLPDNLF